MPFTTNFQLNISLASCSGLAAILMGSMALVFPCRAHGQTPQDLLNQKPENQLNYLLIQPQYPRPAMAPAVFYLLPLHSVGAPSPNQVLSSPYTNQLPYQFPNQVQSLPPQYFIPSPGIPGLNPTQP